MVTTETRAVDLPDCILCLVAARTGVNSVTTSRQRIASTPVLPSVVRVHVAGLPASWLLQFSQCDTDRFLGLVAIGVTQAIWPDMP